MEINFNQKVLEKIFATIFLYWSFY